MTARILVHMPYPLPRERNSGSQVRPYHMYKALEELGYEVTAVTGDVKTRWRAVRHLARNLTIGGYVFCYSEPSTWPVHPIVDYLVYLLLAWRRVPTGIYYRDAYWKFPSWFPHHGWRRILLLFRYRMDLLVFSHTASVMFFPSQSLADLFLLKQPKVPLPPAGEFFTLPDPPTQSRPTKVLYVGGISERYGLKIMLEALKLANRSDHLGLELVCRPADFARERAVLDSYLDSAWLKVHHVTGDVLASIYQQCNIGLIPILRNVYNDMAMPMKLFEYLSYGLPVVATDCTEMADFITRNGVGLIAEDNPESLAEKILRLVRDRDLYEELRRNVRRTLENGNLWTDRARLVAETLAKEI